MKIDKPYYFELYSEKKHSERLWKWKYYYKGRVIAESDCEYLNTSINSSLQRLQKNIHKYGTSIFQDPDEQVWEWKVLANNGNILAKSSVGYNTPKSAIVNRENFLNTARKAPWVKRLQGSRGVRIREVA